MTSVIVSSAGTSGPRGNSILTGSGAPASGLGIDGDWYIDNATPSALTIYGPKAAGAWGNGQSLGSVGAALLKAQNLADLNSPTAARGNLGLGGAAVLNVGASAGTVAAGDDSRLSNSRTPTAHASTHASGGSDLVTPTAIGAYTAAAGTALDGRVTTVENTALTKTDNLASLNSATIARANLGLGGSAVLAVGASTGTVAAGDDSRITGAAQKAQNLADLGNAATARTNLGLGNSATRAVGATAGTVTAGDDSRLSDARTPSAHKASHSTGGSDALSPGDIGAYTAAAGTALEGSVLTKADNLASLANPTTARTSLGLGNSATRSVGAIAGTVAAGDDSRLSDSRPPNGSASGDLSGSYPGPTVTKVNGITVSGTPGTGYVPTATGTTAATWQAFPAATTSTSGIVTLDGTATDFQGHGTATAGSTGKAADAGHTHPAPFWVPADNGLLAAVYDPAHAGTVTSQSSANVAGKVTLTKIVLRQQITWASIWFGLAGIDAGSALTNCYLGVYDSGGTLKGTTADISSVLNVNATAKAVALASSFTATPGTYFIAMLLNGTWTQNSFTFKCSGAGISVNANLAAPNLRYSNLLTSQTSLPSTLTLSSQSTSIIGGGWGSQWYGVQ